MAKFKIFITSSGRTRVLAEKLRDTLTTDYKADLWNKVSKDKPSETRIEMLEEAAREYDFAVVILARDDVTGAKTDDTLKPATIASSRPGCSWRPSAGNGAFSSIA